MQSGREDTLEERYAIKFCFKLGKNATETYGMLQTAFWPSCMNQASVFEWHKRFKVGMESVRNDERCGRSKEVNTPELIGQRVRVRVTILKGVQQVKMSALLKSGQWHFHQDNAPVHNSILVTDYLTKMGIKTVPHPPYVTCLFPKLTGCRYQTIEAMRRLWRRSLTRSYKRTSLGPSRSCWNSTTSALQPEEITWKGTRVSWAYYQ